MKKRNAWLTPSRPVEAEIKTRPLSLPAEYIPAVAGALALLTEPWNWQEAGDITPEQAAEDMAKMLACWGDEPDEPQTQLRLNPDNPCDLQLSYDHGETWVSLLNICEVVADLVVSVGV